MKFKYSDKHAAFILKNYMGITTTELTVLFNRKFHTNITRNQIKGYLTNHKLQNGVVKRFEKGHIPANKGKKGLIGPNRTSFKKGQPAINFRPLGSERVNIYGYIKIKTANPNYWELKHKKIYEKEFK